MENHYHILTTVDFLLKPNQLFRCSKLWMKLRGEKEDLALLALIEVFILFYLTTNKYFMCYLIQIFDLLIFMERLQYCIWLYWQHLKYFCFIAHFNCTTTFWFYQQILYLYRKSHLFYCSSATDHIQYNILQNTVFTNHKWKLTITNTLMF